jgi:hypothetical protein
MKTETIAEFLARGGNIKMVGGCDLNKRYRPYAGPKKYYSKNYEYPNVNDYALLSYPGKKRSELKF